MARPPLAVPVLLDIGRESVRSGENEEALLAEAEAALVAEATFQAEPPPVTRKAPLVHRGSKAIARRREPQGSLDLGRRA